MADRSSYPSERADKFLLRLPDGMRDQLKDAAAENNRSLNAEIVARLEGSFAWPDRMEAIAKDLDYYQKRFKSVSAALDEMGSIVDARNALAKDHSHLEAQRAALEDIKKQVRDEVRTLERVYKNSVQSEVRFLHLIELVEQQSGKIESLIEAFKTPNAPG